MAKQQPKQPAQYTGVDEVYLVAKVDKLIIVSKEKKSFPNDKTLKIDLRAGVPQKVPQYIADSYSKTYPHIYRIADDKEAAVLLKSAAANMTPAGTDLQGIGPESNPIVFNSAEFLNNNHPLSKNKLEVLGDKEIFQIAELLELKPNFDCQS